MQKLSDFDYYLPEGLIAQKPVQQRDSSRLLVPYRDPGLVEHRFFTGLIDYLNPGDCLVFNDTRVIPARLLGYKEGSGGDCELLLLTPLGDDRWDALVRPARRIKAGQRMVFETRHGRPALMAEVVASFAGGKRVVQLEYDGDFDTVLSKVGHVPLPPYIKSGIDDPERYQTVYARERGSVAAPTAGLHFTPRLLESLASHGVEQVFLSLHIGIGTFRPVREERIEQHQMHIERYHLPNRAAEVINGCRSQGGRVIAVGTTVIRTLETRARDDGFVEPGQGETDIFIYPGYRFRAVDGLVTNFHLPKSTLLMLVSAFAGRERVLQAYRDAVSKSYRFFSFGDGMLII